VRVGGVAVALAFAVALLASAASAATGVQVWLTSNDGKAHLTREPDLGFTRSTGSASVTVDVDPRHTAQTITGFGAAFTDSATWLLAKLPTAQREAALRRLLSGIGLSVMRVPMGASDFTASGMYSYDDMPPGQSDPALAHFSIAHDRAYIIPILREALRINPSLRIVANPWSPPAWMKTNDSMLAVSSTGVGRLRPDAYGALARYFVKFIEAYRAAGVPVWAVTPQNEPEQPTTDYPGMIMSAPEEAQFVRGYLAPALRAAHLSTRIYGYDYIWLGSEPYASTLLAAPGFTGIAYHCYFGAPDSMSSVHAAFPAADQIEDECSTGISELSPIQVLVRSVDNWATSALMWNVALNPAGGPKIGSGCLTCIGVTTIDGANVSYTGDFFQLGQVSEFVPRGARRIEVTTSPPQPTCANAPICGLEYAAFLRPDGREVVVATNSGVQPVTFAVRRPDGTSFTYSLPGQVAPHGTDNSRDASVVTFVWR
jgi:glucosylceramidase